MAIEKKITTAVFEPGSTTANAYGLWQWDYGQVLRIQGLHLPSMVAIHFSLQETGGTALNRVGVTKDGVTDVIIPDSMLENDGATRNYDMFAFVYLTDDTSGQTEYKIKLQVKSRPKPEVFDGGENPNIFHEAVQAVRKSADKAAESEKQAEGWAHGREDLPERAQDNAKYYSDQTAEDRKEVKRLVESVSDIDKQVEKVEELSKQTQGAADKARESEQGASLARKGAEDARAAAEESAEKLSQTDKELIQENVPADGKATGDRIARLSEKMDGLNNVDFYFCSAEEIGEDGLPSVKSPKEKIIYFVPNNESEPNAFNEYIWKGQWEYFGSGSIDLSNYVKFNDFASREKAGIVKINDNAGQVYYSGIVIAAVADVDHALKLHKLKDNEILSKSNLMNSALMPGHIDRISVQSTHQDMTDIYDPTAAYTPDGNVSYKFAGKQPASYDAVKAYVDERQYDWRKEPVLEVEITEETAYLYLTEINGKGFCFSEMACIFELNGIIGDISNARLVFAPKLIKQGSDGIIVANTNGKIGKPQKGCFEIKNYPPIGWHSEYSSNISDTWLGGVQKMERHIPLLDGGDGGRKIFASVDKGITEFTIIPYIGALHPGSKFKIYGRPVKEGTA